MFYKINLKDHIRLPPNMFGDDLKTSIITRIRQKFEGYISKELGIVIDIASVGEVKDGTIIPGDGAPYYEVDFELLSYKPELQETVLGRIKDITDFGAFISIGPAEGMIHVSQTMNDYVSFGKDKVLLGKESKRSLKVGDMCRARIIAVSYKDVTNPKIGLTMRQPGLGKLEWLEEDIKDAKKETKTPKGAKGSKGGKSA